MKGHNSRSWSVISTDEAEALLEQYNKRCDKAVDAAIKRALAAVSDSHSIKKYAARQCGVSSGTISNWESGKTRSPHLRTFLKIQMGSGKKVL